VNANVQKAKHLLTLVAYGGLVEKRTAPQMPLKLSLKPGEKFVLNGAVLANGDKRTSLVIQNKACVLREKDIMQPKDAKTPARRVYLSIMMMYLDGEASEEPYNDFALRMTEFMGAIQNREVLAACVEISRDVVQGAFYKALISCRKLFDFEQERLNYDPEQLSKRTARG
jgi:flagellar protein FlbT